jgi:S-formylglutathione hydrolase FrmB
VILRRTLIILCLVCGAGPLALPAEEPPEEFDRIERLALESRVLGRSVPYIVKLPRRNAASYDTVYLLHGWQGDEAQMLKVNAGLATKYSFLLVQPSMESDGGWLDSPVQKNRQYMRMLLDEIVPAVEAAFPARADRRSRAVTGFSMGGQGAFAAVARRPDLFGVVGATGGIMDLTRHRGAYGLREMLGPPERQDVYRRYSVLFETPARLKQIQSDSGLRIFLECSQGDLARPDNLAYAARLDRLGVRYDRDFDHPGKHNFEYFATRIDAHLAWIRRQFDELAGR